VTPVPIVKRANDIARQHAHQAPDQAAAEIARHLERFWERRMVAELHERVAEGDPDLDPLAVAASRLLPRPGPG
jgi:formate dehydrogenase subunit delta